MRQRILFVCMGNICRSPTAEGVTRTLAERIGVAAGFEFDSAGTHGYHIGKAPDARATKAAAQRGYDLSSLKGRQVDSADFLRFDRILAMDRDNLELLRQACPAGASWQAGAVPGIRFQPRRGRSTRPVLWRPRRVRACSRSDRGCGAGTAWPNPQSLAHTCFMSYR